MCTISIVFLVAHIFNICFCVLYTVVVIYQTMFICSLNLVENNFVFVLCIFGQWLHSNRYITLKGLYVLFFGFSGFPVVLLNLKCMFMLIRFKS
jgi:hypothetical protein